MANYVARIADHELDARLRVMGAVLIEGPKACGKTATASQIANTIIRLDEDPVARAQLDFDPQALFSGRPPILFDEWQVEPEIWNRVRRQVDDREEKGQFILTGSARPRDNANRHSGAGRFSVMQMRPMSLFETGHSTGEISLANLLAGERQAGLGTHLSFDNLIRRIITGGWPDLLDSDEDFARDWLADYLRQVIEVDVPEMGHRRNPGNLRRLLESLARGVGQPVKLSDLAKDVGGEGGPVAHETITGYLDALRRLWLTDDSAAWRPHMRSRTRLRTAPVRYFVDPSIGTAALSIGSAELKRDPLALGFHFEARGQPSTSSSTHAMSTPGQHPSSNSPRTSTPTDTSGRPAWVSSPRRAPVASVQTVSTSSRSARSAPELAAERQTIGEMLNPFAERATSSDHWR